MNLIYTERISGAVSGFEVKRYLEQERRAAEENEEKDTADSLADLISRVDENRMYRKETLVRFSEFEKEEQS